MDPLYLGKNLRNQSKTDLKQANIAWSECIVKNYLPDFLNGKNISVNDVCQDEYAKMTELDGENYPTLPFKNQPVQ